MDVRKVPFSSKLNCYAFIGNRISQFLFLFNLGGLYAHQSCRIYKFLEITADV